MNWQEGGKNTNGLVTNIGAYMQICKYINFLRRREAFDKHTVLGVTIAIFFRNTVLEVGWRKYNYIRKLCYKY